MLESDPLQLLRWCDFVRTKLPEEKSVVCEIELCCAVVWLVTNRGSAIVIFLVLRRGTEENIREKVGRMVREPPSLYSSCLVAYVRNLNYSVSSMDRTVVDLRMLPTAILASVYEQVGDG